MATTIQLSESLKQHLATRKLYTDESYEDVIWDMLEDTMELSKETIKEIEKSRAEIKQGKVHSLAKVKRELGMHV